MFMKILIKSLILTLFILLTACSESQNGTIIKSFSNDVNNSTIILGRSLQITVYANYNNGTQKDVTKDLVWSSLDESLATVEDGLIQADANVGQVSINYKTKELLSSGLPINEKTLTFNIEDITLESIRLSESALSLSVGATKSIHAIGVFENGTEYDITNDCIWSSSDSNVTSVEAGLITAKMEGNVTITAMDSNITSNSLAVEAIEKEYVGLKISSLSTSFNVQQTLELQAVVTTSNNETVVLDNDVVTWTSDDEKVITIDNETGIATAITKDTATISVVMKEDSTLKSSVELSVEKDTYVRLFRDGVEISFPNTRTTEYETLPDELSTFTMIAIGKNFLVRELSVRNFSNIDTTSGWFDELFDYQTIYQDENTTFELMHNGSGKELHYYFKINDEFESEFSEKYKESD